MKGTTIGVALAAFLFTSLIFALPVVAQDTDTEVSPDETFTEEVTVTARKREESLQEVPFSVVAPTEEVLRERGAQNLEEVSANVAGFSGTRRFTAESLRNYERMFAATRGEVVFHHPMHGATIVPDHDVTGAPPPTASGRRPRGAPRTPR